MVMTNDGDAIPQIARAGTIAMMETEKLRRVKSADLIRRESAAVMVARD